jgi:hypothetical protein
VRSVRRVLQGVSVAVAILCAGAGAARAADAPAEPAAKPPAKKKAAPKPTVAQLSKLLAEQRALLDAQQQ